MGRAATLRIGFAIASVAGVGAACASVQPLPPPFRPKPPAPPPTQPALPDAGRDALDSDVASEAAPPADAGSDATSAVDAAPPERHPFHEPVGGRALPRGAPVARIANLSPAQCRAELKRLKLPAKRWWGVAKGVATPMRLTGPIGGVKFQAPGGKLPYGTLDCRMVLTLNELAPILAGFSVKRMRIDNVYRPGSHLPGKKRSNSQHAHGLALDITKLYLADGRELSVEDDWNAPIGSTACGPEAQLDDPTPHAIVLRNIACAIARASIFTHMLTPSYNAAHRNHFHFDIKRGAKYRSIH